MTVILTLSTSFSPTWTRVPGERPAVSAGVPSALIDPSSASAALGPLRLLRLLRRLGLLGLLGLLRLFPFEGQAGPLADLPVELRRHRLVLLEELLDVL